MLKYVLAYYLTSMIMAVYMARDGFEFAATIGGRRLKKPLEVVLCSPLLFPFLCIVCYKQYKRKNV